MNRLELMSALERMFAMANKGYSKLGTIEFFDKAQNALYDIETIYDTVEKLYELVEQYKVDARIERALKEQLQMNYIRLVDQVKFVEERKHLKSLQDIKNEVEHHLTSHTVDWNKSE